MRIRDLLKSKFLRNAGAVSAGAAGVQVVAFFASLVLTRLYAPADFGALAVFFAILTFATAVASLHYEMAIALPKADAAGASLAALSLCLATVCSAFTFVLFAPGGLDLLFRMGFVEIRSYWWLLPITIFGAGCQQVLALWNARRGRFTVVAQNSIIQSLTQNGLQIGLGAIRLGSFGLVLGVAFARVVSGAVLLVRNWSEDKQFLTGVVGTFRSTLKEYRTFPFVGLWGAILHVTCFQLPPLLLVDLYSADVAGWYLLQERVLTVPLTVLAQGVASVFYVNAAKLAHEDPGELKRSYIRILKNLSILATIPTIVLLLFGPMLFRFVFGPEWEAAGNYARIFAIPTFFRFVAGPLFRCLTILNRQSLIFLFDGAGLLIIVGASSFFASRGFHETWVVAAIALGITVAYAGLLIAATLTVLSFAKRR